MTFHLRACVLVNLNFYESDDERNQSDMIEVYVEIEILIEVVIEILIANLHFNKLTFATTINKFIPKSHSFSINNSTSVQNTLLPFLDDGQCWCYFRCSRKIAISILQQFVCFDCSLCPFCYLFFSSVKFLDKDKERSYGNFF